MINDSDPGDAGAFILPTPDQPPMPPGVIRIEIPLNIAERWAFNASYVKKSMVSALCAAALDEIDPPEPPELADDIDHTEANYYVPPKVPEGQKLRPPPDAVWAYPDPEDDEVLDLHELNKEPWIHPQIAWERELARRAAEAANQPPSSDPSPKETP